MLRFTSCLRSAASSCLVEASAKADRHCGAHPRTPHTYGLRHLRGFNRAPPDGLRTPMKKPMSTRFFGFVAKHLFVFTPRVSHYRVFDNQRPNQYFGLMEMGQFSSRVTPHLDMFRNTVFGFSKQNIHIAAAYELLPQRPCGSRI